MKKRWNLLAALLVIVLIISACTKKEKPGETEADPLEQAKSDYLSKADVNYAYELSKKIEQFKTNEKLGYRTAGSQAEIDAGNMIFEEMKKIGLEEVTQDEITVDTWEFEKAELSFTDEKGEDYTAVLGAYQTNFDTKGMKEFEVVYGGKATKDDLKDLDVKDKLVLIDIQQDDEWWINYPAYQAYVKGAAAVIAVQQGNYAEIDPTALNAQDIIGPDYAPAFSMSQADAERLKKAIDAGGKSVLNVQFDAKSVVEFDGKTYNYYGKIIGKDPESYIILSGHYDSYFNGFQDDNAAIGLMMGVAKGLIDSGYQPEKTIIFNALAAEEWGTSNTRYDWSTGAYNQIFRVHPEWAGKAVANFNFELPAYEHTSSDEIRAVYELQRYLEKFAAGVPEVEGVYKDGISVVSPLRTWSDDFSFSIAGVPALRNDFQDSDFMDTHYHSQFDNDDYYNEKALLFHLNLYGLLAMYYDQTAVTPLDFTVRMDALQETINEELFDSAGVSSAELSEEIGKVIASAEEVNKRVNEINEQYADALKKNDADTAAKLYSSSRELNASLLEIFKFAQDHFVKLTWEDEPIFAHEHPQNNIGSLAPAIEALEKGDLDTPLDEYLLAVDNNWYTYAFEKEVTDYFTDYVLNQPDDRLMWGAGRIVGHVDLYDTINSLLEKRGKDSADVTAETAHLKKVLDEQKQLLQTTVDEEVKSVKQLHEMLEAVPAE